MRTRDVPETEAENLLAQILVKAGEMGLVPKAEPTGKIPKREEPRMLCGSRRAFELRRRQLKRQAELLEGKDRVA